MEERYFTPENIPVFLTFYRDLEAEMDSFQNQMIKAMRAHREDRKNEFRINGKSITIQQISEVADFFIKKRPHYERRLKRHFDSDHGAYSVRSTLLAAESFLAELKFAKLPPRPAVVDEFLKSQVSP